MAAESRYVGTKPAISNFIATTSPGLRSSSNQIFFAEVGLHALEEVRDDLPSRRRSRATTRGCRHHGRIAGPASSMLHDLKSVTI